MASRLGKAACAAGLFLCGCDLFSTRSIEPRPETLSPERDAFAGGPERVYLWSEGTLAESDSARVLRRFTLTARNLGDTLVGGMTRRRLAFSADDASPLPAGVATALGFQVSRLVLDSAVIPDPGADLPIPERPATGWRVSETRGPLRFERMLTGVDTVLRPEGAVEAWLFQETAYWEGQVLATASYWLGSRGLLRMRARWQGFAPGIALWREVVAR